MQVPFFRPDIQSREVDEVVATLRSGWLTTGPQVRRFERAFAEAVGSAYAVAVNSCTAALHLAVEALALQPGQAVLIPTMTFAATAEIVRYLGGVPLLVDCDPVTGNLDLNHATQMVERWRTGDLRWLSDAAKVVGIIPVHVGGLMMNMAEVKKFGTEHDLWVVEDAAHAFPAAWRESNNEPWQRCGEGTSKITCFSFYANKTITTGEGGMATTNDESLADRMRLMSLHGLSHDAWGRYSGTGAWDYRIISAGFKYNLTDIAAAIGLGQLQRAEEMRRDREQVAMRYSEAFADLSEIDLPLPHNNRIHAWHLFPIKLQSERLAIDRNTFIDKLKEAGIGCSVHWRPLHLHPYYQDTFDWRAEDFPVATTMWDRLISLPIFPGMREEEIRYVIDSVKRICAANAARQASFTTCDSINGPLKNFRRMFNGT
jgi:dTDP-4-amino-4,6-dideoxygalactose transaminase